MRAASHTCGVHANGRSPRACSDRASSFLHRAPCVFGPGVGAPASSCVYIDPDSAQVCTAPLGLRSRASAVFALARPPLEPVVSRARVRPCSRAGCCSVVGRRLRRRARLIPGRLHSKWLVSNDIYYIWNHGPKFGGGFDCRHCPLITRGGGATRFREHLGGIPGDVRECPNVPRNIRAAMRESRDDSMRKKREKKNRRFRLERDIMEGLYHGEGVINIEDGEEEIQAALREILRDKNVSRAVERRRESGSGVRVSLGKQSITAYFDKELSSNKVSMQPKISTALNVESKDVLGQAWAKFFHANDIAGLKANCPYFRAAVKITQNLGPAPVPTAKEIDGIYLDKNYEEAEQWLKMFKQDWRNYGVTVMCDSWTWPTGMSLINFMVYCNARMFFHKSIDASGQTQTAALTGNVMGGLAQGWHVPLQRKCHQLSGGSNLEGKFLIYRSVP
ncbi:uncharacterized protein LOC119361477 [Triticum dicoccoides]|uniref:uncharacterized protein LOC119361477 n=1 Tax=Triticum dicoccoides TaxID=85692 RepID=UPI00188E97B8|nr:uncharacterized protein LOC119361477 [Triticum dicoccoides]